MRLEPVQRVRFSKLPLQTQLMHTAASPSVAYLLLVLGLGLLLFEFFTAGVGVAGRGRCRVRRSSAGYGVAALPSQPWALALILLSMVGFAIDMQTGIPRLWTIIAHGRVHRRLACSCSSSSDRPGSRCSSVSSAWASTVFSGMPAMIRTRFATPTIGREWMIGEMGEVDADVDPEGVC